VTGDDAWSKGLQPLFSKFKWVYLSDHA
jgi:hypothetical protein